MKYLDDHFDKDVVDDNNADYDGEPPRCNTWMVMMLRRILTMMMTMMMAMMTMMTMMIMTMIIMRNHGDEIPG